MGKPEVGKPGPASIMKVNYEDMEARTLNSMAKYDYIMLALAALEHYMDEKGVDFWMAKQDDTKIATNVEYSFILKEVPARFYHKVVVPGFREVCKKWHIDIYPASYCVEKGDCRSIAGALVTQFHKVPSAVLAGILNAYYENPHKQAYTTLPPPLTKLDIKVTP